MGKKKGKSGKGGDDGGGGDQKPGPSQSQPQKAETTQQKKKDEKPTPGPSDDSAKKKDEEVQKEPEQKDPNAIKVSQQKDQPQKQDQQHKSQQKKQPIGQEIQQLQRSSGDPGKQKDQQAQKGSQQKDKQAAQKEGPQQKDQQQQKQQQQKVQQKKTPTGQDNQEPQGGKAAKQPSHQQPESHQPQGVWGGKGSDQQKQSQPQAAWGGKTTKQQRPESHQPQGVLGAKGSDHQKQSQPQTAWGGKATQHQQPESHQPQGVWGGKSSDHQKQSQPQTAWGDKATQQQQPEKRQPQAGPQSRQGHQQEQQQQHGGQKPDIRRDQRPQGQTQPVGRGQKLQTTPQQFGDQKSSQAHGQQSDVRRDQRRDQKPQGQQEFVQKPQQFVEQPHQLKSSPSVSSVTSGISDVTIKSTGSSSQSTPTRSASTLSQRSDVSLSRGTRGRRMLVETNYLELILKDMKDYAYQYDIKFDPEKPKRFLRLAFMEYCKAVKVPLGALAFDGKSNVFSPRQLGPNYVTTCEVKVIEAESGQEKMFKVTLMETQYSAIELKSLKTYQNDRIFDKPMRALQCLDVILSSPCHEKGVRGGRSFYNPPSDGKRIDLSESYELWLGLFQAAVLGERPFLNIDISHRAFPSAVPIINVIQSLAGRDGHNVNNSIQTWLSNALHDYLRGLVVIYTPPKCFNSQSKRFKFQNVKLASNRQEFTIDTGRKLTVAQYFEEKGYRLDYPNLPCIHIGNTIKTNYVPVELCEVAAGQLNLKKAGPRQVQAMIKYAATPTDIRKDKILRQFNYMQHNGHPTLRNFGVGVGSAFIKVDARVLDAPLLEYSSNQKIEPRNGSWNGSDYIKPASMLEWAILILDERTHENEGRNFGNMILAAGRRLKMNISEKFTLFKIRDDRRLEEELRKFKEQRKSIVFVIISGRNQRSYSSVKQNAEIYCGVLTQCIKPETIARRLNPATIQNILLKVNAKLNGLNHRIYINDATIIMQKKNVMFIGADVTHPTPDQRTIPSVVGVVASHDLDGFQYNMQWCLQEPTKEIIIHMQEITLHHLNVYEKINKKLPEVIIYYRDGVSEGQFPEITDVELRAMDAAFSKKKSGYRPNLTCLIVQKRHHTRFFPQARQGVGRFNNVPPGTCVDQTITHPNECQFFLVSHESIQGTAKPTKYCVLRDDSHFNIDDLQAITYNMCHMFARCNRSVSYPAPAYYAHHGASRGKIYIEGANLNMSNLQNETRKREIKTDIISGHPMFFV